MFMTILYLGAPRVYWCNIMYIHCISFNFWQYHFFA